MELFTVNRYTGSEENENTNPNEKILREKLLEKIKYRKRNSDILQSNDSLKTKKRKKLKEANLNSSQLENKNEPDLDEKPVDVKINETKIKKQKCKTETSNKSNEENENELCDDEETPNIENQKAFTILKDPQLYKKQKVKRKLPEWLANACVVSVNLKNLTHTVDSIPDLDKVLVDKLKENNITHFFPVQHQVIPILLENEKKLFRLWPRDICVSAPTGSGKTLAYVLPIVQVLSKRFVPKIRALIVLPVQDLANQVFQVVKTYCEPAKLNALLLSKLQSFEDEQKSIYRIDEVGNQITPVDIIVTTPGRLVEHIVRTKGLCLSDLRYLVIDEADRVMENIQNDWLYHLYKHMNSDITRSYQVPLICYNDLITKKQPPQKLLFSATLSQDPEKLQQLGLFYPMLFTSIVKSENIEENGSRDESKFIGKYTTPAELTEYYTSCTKANKPLILYHLLKSKGWKNILCFVNSVQATTKLEFILKKLTKNAIQIKSLSARLTPKERNAILKTAANGKIDLLISSDALARGIDLPNVEYVVSYDCPAFVKTYVHRIGRTGRAGRTGTSLTFLTSKEVNKFNKMVCNAGKKPLEELAFDDKELEEYQNEFEQALASLAKYIDAKKIQELKRNKKRKKLQVFAERKMLKSGKKKNTRIKIKKKQKS